MTLKPTLWRTCRVLANDKRLACLRHVLEHPDAPVEQLARLARLTPALASLYLRQLQARGLIHACRDGRWVRYRGLADVSVAHAAPLLAALQCTPLRTDRERRRARYTLTGFTHVRRLRILAFVSLAGQSSTSAITINTRISRHAAERHLAKLKRHGLLLRGVGGWELAPPYDSLSTMLLQAVAASASATPSHFASPTPFKV
jgi:DNA-binding transcriptional ArsR family regulator